MELKDHLISKDVGKKFVNSYTKKYEIGFKSGDLGYENKGILSKISFGSDFVPLKKVFPKNKKIELCWKNDDPHYENFYYEEEKADFYDAYANILKFQIDTNIESEKFRKKYPKDYLYKNNDKNYEKIYEKNKLTKMRANYNDYAPPSRIFTYHMNEAYFHHEYDKLNHQSEFFLLKQKVKFSTYTRERIFFIKTHSLEDAGEILINIK